MNRRERRKLEREGKVVTDKVYHLKESDLIRIKGEVLKEAMNRAFFLMMAIPNMIVHDKWDELEAAKLRGPHKTEELFVAHIMELYHTYEEGYVDISDLQRCLYEETGIIVEWDKK